jgi:redox-sensitive bicupin YhaK (pirin superfamily)
MSARTVGKVVYAEAHAMGPLTVRQPLPSFALPALDPFVLLHHAPRAVMSGRDGVDAHPHRGFAPVSFIFAGSVRHRDSRGNDSTIAAGGTQWLHAGGGILHEETPLAGEFELIQMWVNVPARHKADTPAYYPLGRENTPRYTSEDGLVTVNVIAGHANGIDGPIPSVTPVNAVTIEAKAGGRVFVPLPKTHNAFVYLLDGSIALGEGATASGLHQVVFNNDGEGLEFHALTPTRALLMSGEPIGEPVAARGPFVMNTEAEVENAFRDYRRGLMGRVA